MRTVKYCDSVYSAHLICGTLANQEIKSQVINETISSVLPYSAAIDSLQVQVVVDEKDLDRAIEILKCSDANLKDIHCPECGSSDISSRLPSDKKRNVIMRYFLIFIALLSGSTPGYIRSVNYCKSCNKEFNNN